MSQLEEMAQQYKGQTIAIIGNGPSLVTMPGPEAQFKRHLYIAAQREKGIHKDINAYEQPRALVRRLEKFPHPMWTINGAWVYHPLSTLGFLMDDHRFHREATHPQAKWYDGLMKKGHVPIMTSKAYPDYPAMVEYPLKEVIMKFKTLHFGETVDYMIALAGLFEVSKIIFLGCDYNMADRYPGERAGTEYWIGKVEEHGIECDASQCMNLMKPSPWESVYHPRFYGFGADNFPYSDEELIQMVRGDYKN